MKRKILRITMALAIFFATTLGTWPANAMEDDRYNETSSFSANSSIRIVPKIEELKDKNGLRAPDKVMLAAEVLYNSVKNEGIAAFDAEWGWRTKSSILSKPGCCCVFLNIILCGIPMCMEYCCIQEGLESIPMGAASLGVGKIFEQRTQEMNNALESFQLCVNTFVKEPATNSSEYKLITVGQWIMDNRSTKYMGSFHSVSRDMTDVPRLTMLYVNAHGGWTSD